MDAFWCITLSILVLRWWWKRKSRGIVRNPLPDVDMPKITKEQRELREKNQREKDIEYLKKQGYSDELIAVIIPTINNGQE